MEFEPSRVDFRQPNLTKDRKMFGHNNTSNEDRYMPALSVRQATLAAVIALS